MAVHRVEFGKARGVENDAADWANDQVYSNGEDYAEVIEAWLFDELPEDDLDRLQPPEDELGHIIAYCGDEGEVLDKIYGDVEGWYFYSSLHQAKSFA